ncbi:hypothetical protein Sjap_005502 [Stephania japonica]|uniref:Uncharacterized protein n=1 Tax=Stephania japonica TaxID=461633 RepID=A0AAP0PK52_9MAGN
MDSININNKNMQLAVTHDDDVNCDVIEIHMEVSHDKFGECHDDHQPIIEQQSTEERQPQQFDGDLSWMPTDGDHDDDINCYLSVTLRRAFQRGENSYFWSVSSLEEESELDMIVASQHTIILGNQECYVLRNSDELNDVFHDSNSDLDVLCVLDVKRREELTSLPRYKREYASGQMVNVEARMVNREIEIRGVRWKEVEVRFPVNSGTSNLLVDYIKAEEKIKISKWQKERICDDMKREQLVLNLVLDVGRISGLRF